MSNVEDHSTNKYTIEIVRSLTESKKELIQTLGEEMPEDIKKQVLDHIKVIDGKLFSYVEELITEEMYDKLREKIEKQDKKIKKLQEKIESN
ncbi:hypothetical protein M3629_17560 [Paenibacillus polysaccharolyticus]|uniref:hypothetical protein n=1 Tax=Paenibacillus polysaccharolyticus TaxID=582692 RepID=UPI00203E43F8|nr:hypothetical protein [Paenibacillus polysaccharolyticus]MCM3134600.1 hypothetical protein [Paenibacillus polysaccharolyticus]